MSELKAPLQDSLFVNDLNKLITNPVWVQWFAQIANLIVSSPTHTNNVAALTIAAGDLLVGSGVNVLSALTKGTANYKLFMNAAGTTVEWASGTKIGTFTRAMDAVTGDVAYTGVGFKPSHLIFIAHLSTSMSVGFDNGTLHYATVHYTTSTYSTMNVASLSMAEQAGKTQIAFIKTLDTDGFTLTWTRTGETAAATANCYYIAFR